MASLKVLFDIFLNDKFKVAKMRPLLPKDKKLPVQDKEKHPKALKSALKVSSPVTTVANVKTKTKAVSPPSGRKVSIVALEDD